jgi:hypothetical protein
VPRGNVYADNTVRYVIRRDHLVQPLCNTGIMVSMRMPAFFRIRPRSLLLFSRKVGDQQKLGHVGDPLTELFAN